MERLLPDRLAMDDPAPNRALAVVTAYTLTSALGVGNAATLDALQAQRGGLRHEPLRAGGSTWVGIVEDTGEALTGSLERYDCKAYRITGRALAQDDFQSRVADACERYGAHRVGCFVGTICAGLMYLEERYRRHDPRAGDIGPDPRLDEVINLSSSATYCSRVLGITGPTASISTACSSSARVFAIAHRYMQAGLCDAAVVGGIDLANESFIYGFRSLGLLSAEPCRPWDRRRNGLSLGEAAGFALLERPASGAEGMALLGFGESADAHHMTAPHPEGLGAELAMRGALRKAELLPEAIDYINLHGSGTPANDASEDAAVLRVFGTETPCSSTKGWTGHTQGASGITEAVLSLLSIKHGLIPGTLNTTEPDPALGSRLVQENQSQPLKRVLTNSFGFGGNNCALIFGAMQ
jgi:3-oxoacyl-[acyl-carrier-protein] synthase-1